MSVAAAKSLRFPLTLGSLLLLIGLAIAAIPRMAEFLAADACLDRGGRYDYTLGQCDMFRSHPYVPWFKRTHNWSFVFVGVVLVSAGIGVFAVGLRHRASGTRA